MLPALQATPPHDVPLSSWSSATHLPLFPRTGRDQEREPEVGVPDKRSATAPKRSFTYTLFCSIYFLLPLSCWCAFGGLLDLIDRLCTHVQGSCRWCFDAAFRAKVRAVAPQWDAEHKELDDMVLAMLPRDAWCPSCAQLETLLRDSARPKDAGGEGGGGRKKARRGGRKTKAARAAAGADNTHAAGLESRASSQASSLDADDVRSHARGGHQGCPSSNDGAEAAASRSLDAPRPLAVKQGGGADGNGACRQGDCGETGMVRAESRLSQGSLSSCVSFAVTLALAAVSPQIRCLVCLRQLRQNEGGLQAVQKLIFTAQHVPLSASLRWVAPFLTGV